ncbi:MAG: serine hydrolase, partial [Solirubrobacteraceae bacterium]
MRCPSALAFALLLIALPLACRAADPPQNVRVRLDAYMQVEAKLQHFMGTILVARGGHVILAKGYGEANIATGVPNTPTTEFRIGSVTKQFTAMGILMLAAERKLKLTDPVCKYVTGCPADWRHITINELLTHTSGIPDYLDTLGPEALMKLMATPSTPAQLVALFEHKPLEFKPGAKFSYSNSGYVLLGAILERVSGEPYGEFLQRHIFTPLGMTHSAYAMRATRGKNLAQGYRYAGGYRPSAPVNLTGVFSAGGIRSTVLDLYAWDRALDADHGRLVPRALLEKMFAPHVVVGASVLTRMQDATGAEHYGYGWFIRRQFGHLEYAHEGGLPGFTSLNSWFPGQHMYVIVLDNTQSPDIFRIGGTLDAIAFGKPYTIPRPFKAIKLPASALEPFVGTYQIAPRRFITITRKDDQLSAQMTGQPVFLIYPESATHFFLKVVRAQLFFETDASGKATGVTLRQGGVTIHGKRLSAAEAKAVHATPKVVKLAPDALREFVGTYRAAM